MLNDRYEPADLTLVWSLNGSDGKSVAGGKDPRHIEACGIERSSLAFTLPAVDKRTNYVLDLRLENGGPSTGSGQGKLVYGEQRDIEVWPDAAIQPQVGATSRYSTPRVRLPMCSRRRA